MELIRSITEDEELAAFARTLRADLLQAPTGADARTMPARLADAARGSTNGRPAESNGRDRNHGRIRARRPRLGSRIRRPLLRLAAAVTAIPLLFAGLAFAGVELPAPASDAFESVGIELPNQSTDDDTSGAAHDGDSAGSETGQENSAGKLGHGKAEPNPAPADARTEAKPDNGRGSGERGLAPASPPESPGSEGKAVGKPELPPADPPDSPESPGTLPEEGTEGMRGTSGEEAASDPLSGAGPSADQGKP